MREDLAGTAQGGDECEVEARIRPQNLKEYVG